MQKEKLKVNFITYDLPYPLTSGGKIRAYHLLKALCQDYEVTLFSYYRSDLQRKYVSKLKKELGVKSVRLYKRRWVWDLRNFLQAAFSSISLLSVSYIHPKLKKDLLESSGIFHFEAFGPAVYLPLLKKQGAVCVLGNENIEWQIYKKLVKHRHYNFLIKFLMLYDVWKMKNFEHKLYQEASLNLGVSEKDCVYVEKVSGKECYLIRNGVDIEKLSKISEKRENAICFGGNLTYQQNADGLKWFLEKVLSHITTKPLLNIVTLEKPKWLNNYQISVFDNPDLFAPDIYAKSTVFIAPIRIGGGTNIKILEAFGVKTPVVTTKHGARSIGAKGGKHLLVADSPRDFARAVSRLLESKALRDKITKNGYEFVSKNYSWQVQSKKLRQIYSDRLDFFNS